MVAWCEALVNGHVSLGESLTNADPLDQDIIRLGKLEAADFRAALDAADEVGDEASVDLMTQRLAVHEKAAWMLRSSLGDR